MWLRGGGCLICPQHWIRESRVKCKHQEISYKEWVREILQLERICLMKVQKDYQIPNYNGTRNFKDEWFRKKIIGWYEFN